MRRCFREAAAAAAATTTAKRATAKRATAKRATAKGKGAAVTVHEVEDKMQGNEA